MPAAGPPEEYLRALTGRTRAALGDALVAVHLVGSGAWGDWVAGASDVDVLVACDGPLGDAAADALVAGVRHAALPCPARRLELVVHRTRVLRAPGASVPFELNLNTGPELPADHVSRDPAAEPAHWFLIDVALARVRSRALLGPPAADLIGPVPREHVLAALDASLAWHGQHVATTPNAVLNACRTWRFAAEEVWSPKAEAARWALGRGPFDTLVRQALDLRAGHGDGSLDPAAVRALIAGVAVAVRAARPAT